MADQADLVDEYEQFLADRQQAQTIEQQREEAQKMEVDKFNPETNSYEEFNY